MCKFSFTDDEDSDEVTWGGVRVAATKEETLKHIDRSDPRQSRPFQQIPFSTRSMLFHLERIADSHTTELDDEVTELKPGPPALSFLLLLLVDVGKHGH